MNRDPPKLPPRPVPPALPPRPGTSASYVTPTQYDSANRANDGQGQSYLRDHIHQAPDSTLNEELPQKQPSSDLSIMLPAERVEPEESVTQPEVLDIPAIVHTAASSPEGESFGQFPFSHSSSHSSLHSMASYSSGSGPSRPRSSTEGQRPFLELYGKRTVEQDYEAALEELQALEVEEFLTRASKNMEEMKFESPSTTVMLPDIANYRGKDVLTAYLKYVEAWLCAHAEVYLPRDLLAASKADRFSFSRSRLALERLYVLLPPSLLERLLSGHMVNLYRWKDPIKTAKWAGLYLALWYYDQLPAAIFALVILRTLKPKLFPPSPAEVAERLAERRARSREAQELEDDLSKRQRVAGVSQSLAQSVGVAALMGGIDVGPGRGRAISEQHNTAQLEDEFSSDSELDELPQRHSIVATRRHKGKFGMYRLMREMLHRFGPSTMLIINDAADYLEKSKNLILWRRPQATKQSLVLLACWTICLSVMSARLQLKLLLLWMWVQFFIVWPIQDRHPRYRRALNPWWWFLWNVPNDAESALEILKDRAAAAPIRDMAPPQHKRSRSQSASSSGSSFRLHRRSSSSVSRLNDSSSPVDAVKSRHFALLKGMPGHLQFTQTEVFFTSIKGLRGLSSRIWKRSSSSPSDVGTDADFRAEELSGRRTAFRYSLDKVTAVKKESRFDIGVFDTDGLQITFSDGNVVRLASVQKRDEVFAYILAHSANRRAI